MIVTNDRAALLELLGHLLWMQSESEHIPAHVRERLKAAVLCAIAAANAEEQK